MLMLLFLLPDFHGLLVSPYVGQMGFIETSRNLFFVSPDFFVALAFMLLPGHLEVFLLFFLYLGHCCCVFHKAFSALIPPVVPIRKWWITSSTCNMVSKMKGDKAKGSYGFMLSAGGMGTRAAELEEVLDGASTNVLLPKAGLLLYTKHLEENRAMGSAGVALYSLPHQLPWCAVLGRWETWDPCPDPSLAAAELPAGGLVVR